MIFAYNPIESILIFFPATASSPTPALECRGSFATPTFTRNHVIAMVPSRQLPPNIAMSYYTVKPVILSCTELLLSQQLDSCDYLNLFVSWYPAFYRSFQHCYVNKAYQPRRSPAPRPVAPLGHPALSRLPC